VENEPGDDVILADGIVSNWRISSGMPTVARNRIRTDVLGGRFISGEERWPICLETKDGGGGLVCTLLTGHDGNHRANGVGGVLLEEWPATREESSLGTPGRDKP
jgi:hypothetical protein